MAQASAPSLTEINMIDSFAQSQFSQIKTALIRESTFLELAVCAYFCGAESLLLRQSGAGAQSSRKQLISLISRICHLSERNASGLIDSVERLAARYFLIENIVEQGAAAADQWLNCEETNREVLKELFARYKNLSMFDLGIEGVNEKHEASQRELYATVDQSVSRLRRRVLLLLAGVLGVSAVLTLAIWYIWLR
jgi:hypothetical protein